MSHKPQEPVHDDQRGEEGHSAAKQQSPDIKIPNAVAHLPEVIDRRAENGRNREEEREFRRRLTGQAADHAADNSGTGAADPRNHREALHDTDLQRVAPVHVIHLMHPGSNLP